MTEPVLRDGPPWAMIEMIEAQAGLVDPIFARPETDQAGWTIREFATVTLVGCGTSEHAAQAGAALLENATAKDAFEAAVEPQRDGVLIAISHEAGTKATLEALANADARTVLITARPELPTAADLTIPTPLVDTSWCHTVGYTSPLLALTAIAGAADPDTCKRVIEATLAQRPRFADAAARLAAADRILAVGSGVDAITAREFALKVEEAAHVPTTPLGLEKVLHGHLPAADERTGLVLFRTSEGELRDKRAHDVKAAAAELQLPTVVIDDLPPGHPLLAGALALQLLTYEIALQRGTNPDLIRREQPRYRAASDAAAW